METIAERPSAKTSTCDITLKGGRLPDLNALERHLIEMRAGLHLRGVEATIRGTLLRQKEELLFLVAGTNETLRLSRLRRKVQWDVAAKREQAMTREEKRAFDRLRAEAFPPDALLEIVGPLEEKKEKDGKDRLTLQVRAFRRANVSQGAERAAPERTRDDGRTDL